MKIKQFCFFKNELLQKYNSSSMIINGAEGSNDPHSGVYQIVYIEGYPGMCFNLDNTNIQIGDEGVYYLDLSDYNTFFKSFSFNTEDAANKEIIDSVDDVYFIATFYSNYRQTEEEDSPEEEKPVIITPVIDDSTDEKTQDQDKDINKIGPFQTIHDGPNYQIHRDIPPIKPIKISILKK